MPASIVFSSGVRLDVRAPAAEVVRLLRESGDELVGLRDSTGMNVYFVPDRVEYVQDLEELPQRETQLSPTFSKSPLGYVGDRVRKLIRL
jgi:hypothetical protein